VPTDVYMLCGFVGSGKTTYARSLEAQGCVRLSIDEAVFARHGRHGIDYDEGDYALHQARARRELDARLGELLAAGRNVVLDYGFWSKEMRDYYKHLIESNGGRWHLLYFETELHELRRRLRGRNERHDANALFVGEHHFEEFLSRWQPPDGEGEVVVAEPS
jgi:predicted kinase